MISFHASHASASLLLAALLSKPAYAEFRHLEVSSIHASSVDLHHAGGIPHVCKEYVTEEVPLEVWQASIDCDFGQLSQESFESLFELYGGWSQQKSSVKYDPQRFYFLTDFLPPSIQALNNHRFVAQATTLEDVLPDLMSNDLFANYQVNVSLRANCWGTVYEILRHATSTTASQFTVFVPPPEPMLDALREVSYLTFQEGSRSSTALLRQHHVHPGDILLIHHKNDSKEYLDHVAVVIDTDLLFEKAGSGDSVPFRLVDFETLSKIWRPDIFSYEYRRLRRNIQLDNPGTIFGLHDPAVLEQFPVLANLPPDAATAFTANIAYDQGQVANVYYLGIYSLEPFTFGLDGRASLPTSAYMSSSWTPFP